MLSLRFSPTHLHKSRGYPMAHASEPRGTRLPPELWMASSTGTSKSSFHASYASLLFTSTTDKCCGSCVFASVRWQFGPAFTHTAIHGT